MPTRDEMDKPAILMTVVAGVVILAASVPFLPALYCESPAATTCQEAPAGQTLQFDATWFEVPAATAALQASGNSGRAMANLTIEAAMTSAIHVKVDPATCRDVFNPTLQQQPVTVTYTLKRLVDGDQTELTTPQSTFTCADGLDATFARRAEAPDVAVVEASDAESAQASLWDHPAVVGQNETATYQLTLTWVRGRSGVTPPPGLPGTPADTSFSLEAQVSAKSWAAILTPTPPEVVGK